MTSNAAAPPTSHHHAWRIGLKAVGQIIVSMVVLGAMYFLIPEKHEGGGSDMPWLLLQLALFAVVVGIQVPAILKSEYPILRAAVALGVLVPLYLLIFARLYLSLSVTDPHNFSQPLDHASALYFTVTVFATVGFGDIVANNDATRLMVTAQMLVNLIVVGAVIRILASAAQRGIQSGSGVVAQRRGLKE